jgi:hypothetical protein
MRIRGNQVLMTFLIVLFPFSCRISLLKREIVEGFSKGRTQQLSFLFFRASIRLNKEKRSNIQGSMFQAWKKI